MRLNLKEQEIRQLERIEESFMRQVLKTKKGCPIKQMYLELGQAPERFDIFKLRVLYSGSGRTQFDKKSF